MKMFKTYSEQLEILRNRGLNISSNDEAKRILQEENYYALINGYKDLFLGPNLETIDQTETYIPGSEFDEIYSLCILDRNLRAILLKAILKIENQFKSYVSYEFSKNHENYLISTSFNDFQSYPPTKKEIKKVKYIEELIENINKIIEHASKNKDYIKHYQNKYSFVPLWVLVNYLTLGTISTFYSLMKQREKVIVSRHYNLSKEKLERYMKVLTEIRNICAHDERLFNIRLKRESEIKDTQYHIKLGISKDVSGKYISGKNDFFAVLITLKDIMKKDEISKLIKDISDELDIISTRLNTISTSALESKMGLPSNWTVLKNL